MGKIKSAVFIAFYTLLVAVLGFVCLVSFSYGEDGIHKFDSIVNIMEKDADLGGFYGYSSEFDNRAENYLGGGYVAVYYPEGVITKEDYDKNVEGYNAAIAEYNRQIEAETDPVKKAKLQKSLENTKEDLDAYKEDYVACGTALYLNREDVCGGGEQPTDDFKAEFDKALSTVTERYSRLKADGVRVDKLDGYTIRVFLPEAMESEAVAMTYFSYTGELTVQYGSDEASAETIMPARSNRTIADYVSSVYSMTQNGSSFVAIEFTADGEEIMTEKTADAAENSSTLYVKVGSNTVISLSVTAPLTDTLYISSESYTSESATAVATLLSTSIQGTEDDIAFTIGGTYRTGANYGDNALIYMYIAFGVFFVLMMAFFFIRYHLLGFVHLYTYLLFFFASILCVWSIPFLKLSVEVFAAFMLTSVLLGFGNAFSFECARKEYALGKTISTSVKLGYKKCFWQLFDLNIVLCAAGFIGFGIALTNLSSFLFTLGLLSLFSGVCTLAVNRFMWATMMSFTAKKGAFCNFKREEVEDE